MKHKDLLWLLTVMMYSVLKAEAEEGGDQEAVWNLNKAVQVSEQIYNERRRQAQQNKHWRTYYR